MWTRVDLKDYVMDARELELAKEFKEAPEEPRRRKVDLRRRLGVAVISIVLLACEPALAGAGTAHFRSGMKAYNAGSFRNAVLEFRAAVVAEPKNAEYTFWLGAAYYKAGESAYAKQTLRRTIDMAPGSSIAAKAQKFLEDISAYESAQNAPPGTIRGTLVFYFNSNYGNKPDVGAQVWVAPGRWPTPTTTEQTAKWQVFASKSTRADGSGVYQIGGLRPGVYTVLIRSANANGKEGVDLLGKHYTETVTVRGGDTVDVSHDFGMTYSR